MLSAHRILFITGEYPPLEGGVGDYTFILGHEMVRHGNEVAVLTSTSVGQEHPNNQVLCFPWVNHWNLPELVCAARRAVKRFQPDFIHIQYQTAAFKLDPAINMLPLCIRGRYAVTFHDLRVPYLFPKAGRLRTWVNDSLARSCQLVIVTNEDDHRSLARVPRIKHLKTIPIGSNIAQYMNAPAVSAFRQQYGLDTFQVILGYFGLINESKGVEELILALARVRDSGVNAGILIIGGGVGASDSTNSAYLAHVQEIIARGSLGPYVKWTGHLVPEQVSTALQCVDMAVLPYQDGVSLRRGSLMAALAHGLPVISTLPPVSIPEIIPGDTMVLTPARDVPGLAEAIKLVTNDTALRMRLASRSLELANRFAWPEITRQTLEAYDAALAS